ncbi:MAG: hypothetical protein JRN20_06550 [Nitrososphaerota archaeon]|nr:hypothetical protein [Nitrososphaerota archaeon]
MTSINAMFSRNQVMALNQRVLVPIGGSRELLCTKRPNNHILKFNVGSFIATIGLTGMRLNFFLEKGEKKEESGRHIGWMKKWQWKKRCLCQQSAEN